MCGSRSLYVLRTNPLLTAAAETVRFGLTLLANNYSRRIRSETWRKARRGCVNRSKKGKGKEGPKERSHHIHVFTIVIGLVFIFQDVPELESYHLISESRRRPYIGLRCHCPLPPCGGYHGDTGRMPAKEERTQDRKRRSIGEPCSVGEVLQ